jgi:hypothetical protein
LLFKHEYLDEKLLIPKDRKKTEMKREDEKHKLGFGALFVPLAWCFAFVLF